MFSVNIIFIEGISLKPLIIIENVFLKDSRLVIKDLDCEELNVNLLFLFGH